MTTIADWRDRGLRVLSARPTTAEMQRAHLSLIDLLDGIDPAVLDALRSLAASGPVLVALEDLPAEPVCLILTPVPSCDRAPAIESRRSLGTAALLANDPARAAGHLREIWERSDDPGAWSVAPDLVEALTQLGELAEARAIGDRLARLADEQRQPMATASARRCAALVRLTSPRYDDDAAAALEQAAADYARLGLRFEQGRSLLALGRAQRRARRWGAAHGTLERANAAFEAVGSEDWAGVARAELDLIRARRPRASGELTPAERRVVKLAASGLSNKEIAQQLVVTVNTVEAHLYHAYARLGVRSRSQLAARYSQLR